MKQIYYSEIKNSTAIRKNLLNSSKLLVQSLKSYSDFVGLREQKMKLVFELRRLMEEIDILNRKLRKVMPKADASPQHIIAEEREVRTKTGIIHEEVLSKEKNKIALLEEELAKIESKLDTY